MPCNSVFPEYLVSMVSEETTGTHRRLVHCPLVFFRVHNGRLGLLVSLPPVSPHGKGITPTGGKVRQFSLTCPGRGPHIAQNVQEDVDTQSEPRSLRMDYLCSRGACCVSMPLSPMTFHMPTTLITDRCYVRRHMRYMVTDQREEYKGKLL